MISPKILWLLFGTALLIPAGTALGTTVTLNPDKDNTIVQVTPLPGQDPSTIQLSNATGDIFVGRTNQDGNAAAVSSIRRGLIHFNVSSLPAGAVITGAMLKITNVMTNNGDQTLTLNPMLQDWGQGTSFFGGGVGAPATNNDATWLYTFFNSTTPASSPTWTTPGGSFSSVSASAVDPGGQSGNIVSWSSAQMVADLQNWFNNPSTNFGWGILGNESVGQSAKRLNSSESANPPTLEITYTVVPEPAGVVLGGMALAMMAMMARRRNAIN
jgi:hypothetical protein